MGLLDGSQTFPSRAVKSVGVTRTDTSGVRLPSRWPTARLPSGMSPGIRLSPWWAGPWWTSGCTCRRILGPSASLGRCDLLPGSASGNSSNSALQLPVEGTELALEIAEAGLGSGCHLEAGWVAGDWSHFGMSPSTP